MQPRAKVLESWERVRSLPPRRILVFGFVVFVLYGFPGYMSTDSAQQLLETRTGVLGSTHPPIMAKEWGLLDAIVSGPLLMLLLQGLLFLGGVYVICQRFVAQRTAAWIAIALLLFPPVLTPMAVIWKDSQMAAYLVAGTAAMLNARLRVRLVGLGLLVVACALRHNAFGAVVPLVFFVFEWRPGIRWWKRIAILGAVAVASVGLAFGITQVLAVNHAKVTPVIADIAGVIAFTDQRSDEDLRYVLRGTKLVVQTGIQERARTLYRLGGPYRLTSGDDRLFDNPSSEEEWNAFGRAWKDLVFGDPVAYLESHWFLFARVIGLSELPRASVWNLFLEVTEHGKSISHDASRSGIQVWIGQVCTWVAEETPFYRPFVYAVIAMALLLLCCRDRLSFGLFTSGLLYELSFFPTNADPDYRYSHWLIMSTCIATVIVFVQRWRMRAT